MKQIRMTAILMALVLGVFTSCTKNNDGTASATTAVVTNTNVSGASFIANKEPMPADGPITAILLNNTWKINSYNGSTETNPEFADYLLNFSSDNTLFATYRKSHVYDGYWSVEETKSVLYMSFGEATSTLSLFDGYWRVLASDRSMVTLQREDGSATMVLEKTQNTF
jgi:hypothetical protein